MDEKTSDTQIDPLLDNHVLAGTTINNPDDQISYTGDTKLVYMAPNEPSADVTSSHKSRRNLSKIGLIIGIGLFIFSIVQFAQANTCSGEFCGLFIGMTAFLTLGVALIFLIPSITGFVTSSKSYNDNTKRSKIGIVFGIVITIVSIVISAYPTAVIGNFLTDSSTALNFIKASMMFLGPLLIAGLSGIYIGLNLTFKSLRINKRKMLTFLSFSIIFFGLISYGVYSFYAYKDENANYIKKVETDEKQRQVEAFKDADFIHTQASTIKDDSSGKSKIYTNTYLGISITYPSNWIQKNNSDGRDSTTLMTIASPEMAARKDIEAPYDVVLTYENINNPTKTNDNLPIYLWREKEKGNNTYDYITNQYSEKINSIDFIEYDASYFRYQCFAALFIKGDYIIGLGFDNTLNKSALENNTELYNILHSVKLAS